MFTPRTFNEITADGVEAVRGASDRITDFNIGSIIRTLIEAQAVMTEDFYQSISQAIQDAIPASLYAAFDFSRLPASVARGKVRYTITVSESDVVIPLGTTLSTAGGEVNFQTDEELTIPAGLTVGDVSAVCITSGVVGNVPANTITIHTGPALPIVSVTNPVAFAYGADGESDQAMKARFIAYINSVARATPAALEYAARSQRRYNPDGTVLESVERVAVREYAGYLRLFIYNGSGSTSDELIAQVQRTIDGYYDELNEVIVGGYRSAGVFVWVGGMGEKAVNVTVQADLLPGYGPTEAMATAIRSALNYAIRTHPSGDPLTVAKMQNAILAVPGVQDVLIVPAQSIPCAANEALLPGTVTVEWI